MFLKIFGSKPKKNFVGTKTKMPDIYEDKKAYLSLKDNCKINAN